MLMTRFDAARDDAEWQAFLAAQDFGQLVVNGPDGAPPLVVPTHYRYDGGRVLECHLHRDNPVWAALEASAAGGAPARAVFAVLDADVYIPTQWNAPARTDPQWSAPTSYYAAVQAVGRAAVVDDPAALAALLTRQMGQMQPEGGHAPVVPGPTPFGRMLAGIRGLRLEIEEVRAKFKFGGNRTAAHQGDVAARLAERDGPGDRAARAHLLRRAAGAPERAAASAGCPASAHGVADSQSATGATPAARCLTGGIW